MKLRALPKPLGTCWCGLPLEDWNGYAWMQFENEFMDGPWAKVDLYECPARHIIGAIGPPQDRDEDDG